MKLFAIVIVGGLVLLLCLLTGCTDAPSECGGQSLEALRAEIPPERYEVIYTDLPRGVRGSTIRLGDGPAIVYVEQRQNRISRDGALSHELACHVLHQVPHPPKPPVSNIAVPDRGRAWNRLRMGAPD